MDRELHGIAQNSQELRAIPELEAIPGISELDGISGIPCNSVSTQFPEFRWIRELHGIPVLVPIPPNSGILSGLSSGSSGN